jgi:hypothetical protein
VASVPRELAVPPEGVTKNWTLAMVPSLSEALAVTEMALPTPGVEPLAGAVIATIGTWFAATVTVTEELVA